MGNLNRLPSKTTFRSEPFATSKFSHYPNPLSFMAKTEVILTNNIVGLGAESDHVKVAAGYARNYLFPQRLAIPAFPGTTHVIDSCIADRGAAV